MIYCLINETVFSLFTHFTLFMRILNMSTQGIKCAKNRNKHVNKGKQAYVSSNRIETIPLR